MCNKYIKFEDLYRRARQIGCDYVATGHYARIEKDEETGRYLLTKSVTDKKDQTYALYNMTQDQLEHTLLPIGDFEKEKVREILASENHLILISPRRFGKTSLVQKVTKGLSRPVFQLNLQLVTGTADFAARLLWIMLQQYPMERLKHLITHFRFIPTISTNPMTDGIEVSFQPSMDGFILLEDVFTLIDKLGMKNPHKKPIVSCKRTLWLRFEQLG